MKPIGFELSTTKARFKRDLAETPARESVVIGPTALMRQTTNPNALERSNP